MAYEQILYDTADRIATITLNRPDRMNAMPPKMIGEIHDALQEANRDGNVRAAIVTGRARRFAPGWTWTCCAHRPSRSWRSRRN
jgi:enoyl-CoA hydratase/carnithine racemase